MKELDRAFEGHIINTLRQRVKREVGRRGATYGIIRLVSWCFDPSHHRGLHQGYGTIKG